MPDEIEERLRSHARSFDSLLSLIPAKLYYGEDVSDQWKRKKQTTEQKRAAKMAKLDPDNWKSAKDVMDERSAAAKRKRDEESKEHVQDSIQQGDSEQPKVVQDQVNPKTKKRKLDEGHPQQQTRAQSGAEDKKQKLAEKKAAKKEKKLKEREKLQRQQARKQAEKAQRELDEEQDTGKVDMAISEPIPLDTLPTRDDVKNEDEWSTASSSEGVPDVLSPPDESGGSSISSIPPSVTEQSGKPKPSTKRTARQSTTTKSQSIDPVDAPPPQTKADRDAARARLANAISTFRTARKADDSPVDKPRNRAELLEQRRKKEEVRREAKKEQRRKEREEAARQADAEIARRFSPGGSGSLLASPRSPPTKDSDISNNNFSYGRIEFEDGSRVDSTQLEGLLDERKKKGPQDIQTALKAAQHKAGRLAGLDEQKRKELEEKDMWLNAKRRAHGERVKDDTSLLKKALKRQEGQKKKSEKEWTDRKDGVQKALDAKQRKRNENLAKRKDDNFARKVGKKGKQVKRPGFEGSFRGRTGGGKKKTGK